MCIERAWFVALSAVLAAVAVPARAEGLTPELSGVAFLLGGWTGGRGQVADTGGTSTGSSRFQAEAGGSVLLRRDHTELFGRGGQKTGGFDQIMMIYPEGGTLHGDYADGTHLIHYTAAVVVPGRSVTFTSSPSAKAPSFRLAYTLTAPAALAVQFAMSPPGSAVFRPVATGTLVRDAGR